MPARLAATELKALVRRYGRPSSAALGIDLRSRRPGELSRWFLASILYARPIREETAARTYEVFEADGRTTAERLGAAGWEGLVGLLDAGGDVRYDFSTAERLLAVFGKLQAEYGGDLNRLHAAARDGADLVRRLKGLGVGVGDVTVAIFWRDLRGIWPKAGPAPTPLERLAMGRLGIADVERTARRLGIRPVRLQTALARYGIRLRRGGPRARPAAAPEGADPGPRPGRVSSGASPPCECGRCARSWGTAILVYGHRNTFTARPPQR